MYRQLRLPAILVLCAAIVLSGCTSRLFGSAAPIKVGLIAPLSGGSATSGEAIRRGMLIAINEINSGGGVLGRPIELVVRDVANDKEAGVAALRDLIDKEGIVAVFGGIFSPVMVAQLDLLHERQIPLINPWGSVSSITRNGRSPNYAFRVSVSDVYADEFLVRYALDVVQVKRPAIIADTTAWGDSNVAGLTEWLSSRGLTPAAVTRFDQGDTDMRQQVDEMRAAGADSILMVANAPEGGSIMRALRTAGWSAPVISHWGISGGKFVEVAGVENTEGVYTLQTFSFLGERSPKAELVMSAYHAAFKTRAPEEIGAPVGVAHGYDGMHLLALAIAQAGGTDGPQLRAALEDLRTPFDGLIKRYDHPFTADQHDALLADDYLMAVWRSGQLVPAPVPQLSR